MAGLLGDGQGRCKEFIFYCVLFTPFEFFTMYIYGILKRLTFKINKLQLIICAKITRDYDLKLELGAAIEAEPGIKLTYTFP